MPEEGKLPELERIDNRTKIYEILLKESLTRTELEKKSGFSKSTVANHLNDLLQEEVVEKAIENNRMVYRATLIEEKIVLELKKQSYEFLYNILYKTVPEWAIIIDLLIKLLAKRYIVDKKRDLEGLPSFTYGEKNIQIEGWINELITDQDLTIIKKSKHKIIKNEYVELLKTFANIRMV